jgi:predicted restriction endonuclease
MALEDYIDRFSHLNMNSPHGRKSPHKVCMLLAVMDLIQAGKIHCTRIELDKVLRERFTHYFDQFSQGNDSDKPELPFFHLRTEGFWQLTYQVGYSNDSVERYSKRAVSHATIDQELFDYMKSTIVSNDLKIALTENLTNLPELYIQWLHNIGKSDKTAKNYLQAVQGSISNWLSDVGLVSEPLTEIRSYRKVYELTEKARHLDEFLERDSKGKGMYSAAVNSYVRFLSDLSQVDLKTDVQQILEDKALTATEKTILTNARMGQGRFREQLICLWDGCAVTGYPDKRLLVASHIKPWSKSNNQERLDKFNGLLLQANLDKAFDLGFISFADSGKVMISSQLERPEVLGIKEGMAFQVWPEHRKYLDCHRKGLFRQ